MTRVEDALDRHVDDLLAGGIDGPGEQGTKVDQGTEVDVELDRAARIVSLALARFHPSFRFEERLAARLRQAAEGDGTGTGAVGVGDPSLRTRGPAVIIPFATSPQRSRGRSRRVNGALIGGAISAGVSIASIAAGALVARRRGRGDGRWERVI